METAIRWSPRSTEGEQRFLIVDVAGKSLKQRRVLGYRNKVLRSEEISRNNKVPAFRAFDWSAANESIVAVGQWSGETTVLSLSGESQPFSLPIKQQRQCNAVAFNSTTLLATGLERVRNDHCLNIYDLYQKAREPPSPILRFSKEVVNPVRKLSTSEGITSIKFFPTQPDILVAGVKGTCIRLYDLRQDSDSPVLQCPTSCVHNIAVDPIDDSYFASAGPQRESSIQIWDRRSATSVSAAHMGSGHSSDTQIGPILEVRNAFDIGDRAAPNALWSMRYCIAQKGCLGVLSSSGQLRIIQTNQDYLDDSLHSSNEHSHLQQPVVSSREMYVSREYDVERARVIRQQSREEADRIVSFDFVNMTTANGKPCAILLRGNQEISIYELIGQSSALGVSVCSEISVSSGSRGEAVTTDSSTVTPGVFFIQPRPSEPVSTASAWDVDYEALIQDRTSRAKGALGLDHGFEANEKGGKQRRKNNKSIMDDDSTTVNYKLTIQDALAIDDRYRRRCAAGYLFDCEKNAGSMAKKPYLQEMWIWLGQNKSNARNGEMCTEELDLGYTGLFAVWNNNLGKHRETRQLLKNSHCDVNFNIKRLGEDLALHGYLYTDSSKRSHRLLCLHTLGLCFNKPDLESKVNQLAEKGKKTEAAFLALAYNLKKLAFDALRYGGFNEDDKTLSIAIMSFARGEPEEGWPEMMKELWSASTDPFYRAIARYLAKNDWGDALRGDDSRRDALPLRYAAAVALIYFEDAALTRYINRETANAIALGHEEGILMTGLSEKTIDLFQVYMTRSNDLQTVVLALSFGAPLYIRDPRFDMWRDEYRAQMNSWKFFKERVAFDIQSTRMASTRDGQKLIPTMPRQITLRCNTCDQGLHRNQPPKPAPAPPGNSSNSSAHDVFGDAKSGIICPRCGTHLSRCEICDRWLGVPDPHTRGANDPSSKKDMSAEAISMCMTCQHFCHLGHANEWFSNHAECPAPDCDCRCQELDSAGRV